MEEKELEQLQATRDLIADEKHFTKRAMARDGLGWPCDPSHPEASSWCVTGAWQRVTGATYHDSENSYDQLMELCDNRSIFAINDDPGHAAVLAMLDQAIARQQEVS
jgi:hypothetical protein